MLLLPLNLKGEFLGTLPSAGEWAGSRFLHPHDTVKFFVLIDLLHCLERLAKQSLGKKQ